MNLKSKWIAIAGAVALVGIVGAGAAMAAGGPGDRAAKLKAAVEAGKITQGQADVMQQVGGLRDAARTKLQADVKAALDQAVKDGKITQAQADQLTSREGHHGKFEGKFEGKGAGRHLTPEQLKAKLDAEVKAGKITQEQADKILQKMSEWQNRSKEHKSRPEVMSPATPPAATQVQ